MYKSGTSKIFITDVVHYTSIGLHHVIFSSTVCMLEFSNTVHAMRVEANKHTAACSNFTATQSCIPFSLIQLHQIYSAYISQG